VLGRVLDVQALPGAREQSEDLVDVDRCEVHEGVVGVAVPRVVRAVEPALVVVALRAGRRARYRHVDRGVVRVDGEVRDERGAELRSDAVDELAQAGRGVQGGRPDDDRCGGRSSHRDRRAVRADQGWRRRGHPPDPEPGTEQHQRDDGAHDAAPRAGRPLRSALPQVRQRLVELQVVDELPQLAEGLRRSGGGGAGTVLLGVELAVGVCRVEQPAHLGAVEIARPRPGRPGGRHRRSVASP
jgi:hypothetical protein